LSSYQQVERGRVRFVQYRLPSIIPTGLDQSYLWLKLDIEGAEYEVLRDTLRAGIRPAVISAEFHDYFGANGAGLVAELESLNYSVLIEGSGDTGNVERLIHAELRLDPGNSN
jgi:hypothetical protein